MDNFYCELNCSSSGEHLSQLYTGFGLLARHGAIRIKIHRANDYQPGVTATPKLEVIINNAYRIIYDAMDSERVIEGDLDLCHYYFKRSFNPSYIDQLPQGGKIYPLGFNYPVYGPGDYAFRRSLWSFGRVRGFQSLRYAAIQFVRSSYILSRLLGANGGRFNSHVETFESVPSLNKAPRILFMTRAWGAKPGTPAEVIEERSSINLMRAECIRRLRKEFGGMFLGGFQPSRYSHEHYRDCVVDDARLVRKQNYVKLVKNSDICIATSGLLHSNGWKIGEYIAGAKAIVTEELYHSVPGNFSLGRNYLQFKNSDECVERVSALVQNPTIRYEMMKANHDYYHAYLRPDMLVLNTLRIATQDKTYPIEGGEAKSGRDE